MQNLVALRPMMQSAAKRTPAAHWLAMEGAAVARSMVAMDTAATATTNMVVTCTAAMDVVVMDTAGTGAAAMDLALMDTTAAATGAAVMEATATRVVVLQNMAMKAIVPRAGAVVRWATMADAAVRRLVMLCLAARGGMVWRSEVLIVAAQWSMMRTGAMRWSTMRAMYHLDYSGPLAQAAAWGE